jgi:hypothetical protein
LTFDNFMRSASWILALILAAVAQPALAIDWLTAPSYYTHDPVTAERVNQYAAIGPFYYYGRPDYIKSGYRHYRSTIQAGGSADNLHIVEEWGRPVIPYEQWRFPYRPFGSPYQDWGPPFGGLGGSAWPGLGYPGPWSGAGPIWGGGPWGGGGWGGKWDSHKGDGKGDDHGGHGHGHKSGPYNFAQPWMDGYWPEYDLHDRSRYYEPYLAPKK